MSSLFKGKRNDESNGTPLSGGLTFNQVFTGEAFVTPLIFNPNAEQLKRVKGLPDKVEVNEPNYIVEVAVAKGSEEKRKMLKINLLCGFNPNTMLPKPKEGDKVVKYADKYFLNFDIMASSSIVTNKNRDKVMVIDGKLNSCWVECDVEKAVKLNEELKAARKSKDGDAISDAKDDASKFIRTAVKKAAAAMGDVSYGAAKIDLDTVRIAREGEEPLAKLIFDMTAMSPVRYMTKEEGKKLQKEDAKKYEARKKAYEEFDMSMTEEIFNLFVTQKFDAVNTLIFDENKEWFESDGQQCKVGVFLGARLTEDHKVYQSCMRPSSKLCFGDYFTFKKYYSSSKAQTLKDFPEYGNTFMPKETAKRIVDQEYGYQDIWQDSFAFQPYFVPEFTAPEESVEVESKDESDDLPF